MKNKLVLGILLFLLLATCPCTPLRKNVFEQHSPTHKDPEADWDKAFSFSKDNKNGAVLLVIRDAVEMEGGLEVTVFFGIHERRIGHCDFPPLAPPMTFCFDITQILMQLPEMDSVETRFIMRDRDGFDVAYRKIEIRLCDLHEVP
jgi:hypothetical protein